MFYNVVHKWHQVRYYPFFIVGMIVKIEKHNHEDREQQLRFYKKVHIILYWLSQKKGILVMLSIYFLFITCIARKKSSNLLIWQKPFSRQRQMSYSTWRNWLRCIVYSNWTNKLPSITTFKVSSEKVIVVRSEKMKEKYMKEHVWKRVLL